MSAPVRAFCAECLRSVEMPASGQSDPPARCVHCDAPLDVRWDSETLPPDATTSFPPVHSFDEERNEWSGNSNSGGVAESIGRFQLRELLGGGGYGHVYRAYDPRLDREVALKVLRDQEPTPRVVERFFREARTASQLDHPNIVPIHDAGRAGGRCWIAYEFIDGPNLSRYGDGRVLEPREAARLVLGLAEALDHAHARGIYHRDLKPANVLIDSAGRPRLTDFGLARRNGFDAALTRDGAVLGTPAYMSPEQAAGMSREADSRSDLYSLGVVLYELLCGRRPRDSAGPGKGPLPASPPPLAPRWPFSLAGRVPRELDRICRRSLSTDPRDRYPDAGCLASDIRRWLHRTPPRWLAPAGFVGGLGLGLILAGPIKPRVLGPVAGNELPAKEGLDADLPIPLDLGGPRNVRHASEPWPPAGIRYIGREGSPLYHHADCRGLGPLGGEGFRLWSSAEDPRLDGRKPCTICNPSGLQLD